MLGNNDFTNPYFSSSLTPQKKKKKKNSSERKVKIFKGWSSQRKIQTTGFIA